MSNKEERKAPVLRFKGFTDDWEQRKLGDKITRIKSYSISHGYETMHDTNTKYIHYGDIHTGKVKIINDINILPNIKDNNYIGLNKGDIVVADASEDYKGIADACLVNTDTDSNKIVAGLHTIALRPQKDTYPQYLYTYLSTDIFKHFGYKTGTGLKVFGISYKELAKFLVSSPSIKEQKEISKLISLIEKNIDLQQRKLDTFLSLKKSISDKVFNDKNNNSHSVFFKNRVKGKYLFMLSNKKGQPELPVLSATQDKGMVLRDSINKNIQYDNVNLSNYKVIEPGDFVIHLRSFQGGFAYSNITGIASPAYNIFKFKNKFPYNPTYWKEKFRSYSFIQLLKKVTYGIRDGRTISFNDFSSLYLTFPDIGTQNRIGKLFNSINNQIDIQQRIVKDLKDIRHFLLQNMFI